MIRKSVTCVVVTLAVTAFCRPLCCQQPDQSNGIFVGQPKVYDDHALQQLLANLRARLGQLTGLDQSSLTNRLGTLQGASSQTSQFAFQANATPVPGVTTTTSSGTPGTQQTAGTVAVSAPTGLTTTTSNQTVTTAPSSTTQKQTQAPTVTPVPPTLPSVTSFSLPSTFSTSASDTLNEQMQLSYEIINLQMLLQGSLDDEYVGGTNLSKHHVTIGFPISIATPADDDYRNSVAEVEVSVCDPKEVEDYSPPSLMTILPREKTYNVASIVNKSVALGAGAVVGGILNVGGNFLWGRQTYYVVQAQDTVAMLRAPRSGVCPAFEQKDQQGKVIKSTPSIPLTFVWQFRPVLGQKTVHQGLRQTFAQVSFPPAGEGSSLISITTRWRSYDAKTGIVGDVVEDSSQPHETFDLATFNASPYIQGVRTSDNGDGSLEIEVDGHFLPGSKVRIGDTFLDESTPGFQNTARLIRFTALGAAIAQRGAAVVGANGIETEITPNREGGAVTPHNDEAIVPVPLSDTLMRLAVPLPVDTSSAPPSIEPPKVGGPYPVVVNIGNRTFGMPDAPFSDMTAAAVVVDVPKDLVRTQDHVIIKRLFLGKNFAHSYPIERPSGLTISSITIQAATKDKTQFLILGSKLKSAEFVYPKINPTIASDETCGDFTMSATELDGLKQFVIRAENETPLIIPMPEVKAAAPSGAVTVTPNPISVPKGTKQTFTATQGAFTWSVNCSAGGNACGTIDPKTGVYTAPATPPNPNTVTVTATSTADTSKSGTATVTIN